MDRNVAAKHDVPLWSETRWHGCWNPDAGAGLYLHAGRYRKDLDVWWTHVAAYLPGRRLVVANGWGRPAGDDGVRFGNVDLTLTGDGGWVYRFDGVGQLTSYDDLTRGTRGAGTPWARVRWEARATPVSPLWSPYDTLGEKQDFAGDAHVQGGYRTTGTLWVDGEEHPLDGVGFNDHSSGVRDFTHWGHHRFLLAVMPGWTMHAATLVPRGDRDPVTMGVLYRDGEGVPVTGFELPGIAELGPAGPQTGTVHTADGRVLTLTVEQVHGLPITITQDNENVNGVEWERPDAVAMIEGVARVTTQDGEVGHAFLERSARCAALPQP